MNTIEFNTSVGKIKVIPIADFYKLIRIIKGDFFKFRIPIMSRSSAADFGFASYPSISSLKVDLMSNSLFDPTIALYTKAYENTQHRPGDYHIQNKNVLHIINEYANRFTMTFGDTDPYLVQHGCHYLFLHSNHFVVGKTISETGIAYLKREPIIGFYTEKIIDFKEILEPNPRKNCECGSESLGYTTHSTWCPKSGESV